VVRLAKTVKLANTRNVVSLRVDAKEGATGIFLPKPLPKQHLLLAPIVTKVEDGLIHVAILNVEGRREKLPARGALGTWIPTTDDMQILLMNGSNYAATPQASRLRVRGDRQERR
jgi:hypothetical protein